MTEASSGKPKYGKGNSWDGADKVRLQCSSDHTYSLCRSPDDH